MFAHLDKDGNGKLTSEECAGRAVEVLRTTLRVAGKEKNGELTKAEFLAS